MLVSQVFSDLQSTFNCIRRLEPRPEPVAAARLDSQALAVIECTESWRYTQCDHPKGGPSCGHPKVTVTVNESRPGPEVVTAIPDR